jgi:hypothetical protein
VPFFPLLQEASIAKTKKPIGIILVVIVVLLVVLPVEKNFLIHRLVHLPFPIGREGSWPFQTLKILNSCRVTQHFGC